MKNKAIIIIIICLGVYSGNAQSLGGIDLSRFVFGDNQTKTSYFDDPNSAYSSGFYNNYTGTNMPYQTWWHMITNRHVNFDNNYQFQIAADFWGDNSYFRKLQGGVPTPWRRILNDGQDLYAANLNQYLRTTDNVTFSNLFLKEIHINSGDNSMAYFGPNTSFGGNLCVGAGTNRYSTNTAQVISTNGNLHLDAGSSNNIYIAYYNAASTFINPNGGNVLIGKTSQTNPNYKLDVAGNMRANKLVVNATGADFVFNKKYSLRPLPEVEKFIQKHKHLPGIEPAKIMSEDGLDIGEYEIKLLQKIEELTLYMIEMKKDNEQTKKENNLLKQRIEKMENGK